MKYILYSNEPHDQCFEHMISVPFDHIISVSDDTIISVSDDHVTMYLSF